VIASNVPSTPSAATQSPHHTHGPVSLWAGVLGAPAIWGAQQVAIYALTPWVCPHGKHYLLNFVTAVCLAGAATAALLCWRDWSSLGRISPDLQQGDPDQRTRFLGVLGLMLSALSFLVIAAQGSATFFFDPCWN
jgi:hypothetical protein